MAQEEWLTQLIREYYSALFRSAYSYLGDEAASQDLVDSVFANVWDKRAELAAHENIAGYLFVAVRNRALNTLNSAQYAERRRIIMRATDDYPGVSQRDSTPDESVEVAERQNIIWGAIADLPERTRAILTMRWQHQMQWDEIAQALGLSGAAVKMAHTRALQLLKQRLPSFFANASER